MYAGRVVERAPAERIFDQPAHPYTEALLRSMPQLMAAGGRLPAVEGSPPSIYEHGSGCPFAERCGYVMAQCWREFPPEIEVSPGQSASCWRHV
jgi:oligopeptide/dipeptide ABC transporter ATP-binding protein